MKAILLILSLSFICTSTLAQTGTEILFTKGAELEYKTFSSRPKGFKLELYEVTRITLIVTDVIDSSNHITYSYITKKGTGITNPEKDHYEKKLVVTRTSEGIITLPVNLYTIDTSYLADKYPDKKKMKGFHAIALPKGNDTYTLSVDLEKGKFNYSPQTIVTDFVVRDIAMQTTQNPNYNSQNAGPTRTSAPTSPYLTSSGLEETKYSITCTINNYKVEDKTKVTTPAGNFDCYRITAKVKATLEKYPFEAITTIYYHPEIGFIKWGQGDGDAKTGNIELIRVKR